MRRLSAVAFAVLFSAACDSASPDVAAAPTPQATGPYVSVAVDNHFHDIHPEDQKTIAADRAFVVRNEGRNLHNITILGTNINRDVRPGRSLTLDPVGDSLDPGTYRIVCKYHDYVGMNGEITIVE